MDEHVRKSSVGYKHEYEQTPFNTGDDATHYSETQHDSTELYHVISTKLR